MAHASAGIPLMVSAVAWAVYMLLYEVLAKTSPTIALPLPLTTVLALPLPLPLITVLALAQPYPKPPRPKPSPIPSPNPDPEQVLAKTIRNEADLDHLDTDGTVFQDHHNMEVYVCPKLLRGKGTQPGE